MYTFIYLFTGLLAGGASRYNMSLVNLLRITPDVC